ncbi:MAG: RNA recognition motif domain-containing protein [Planctomycetota bacterium]|jgi:RNA recognition motif-containing protein
MDIYVGNLPSDVGQNDLREIFEKFGDVTEVRLIKDQKSGKSKNYAFVEMPSQEEAEKAIEEMNGKDIKERAMSVSEAKPKKPRSHGGRAGGKKRGGTKRGGKGKRGVYGGEGRSDFGIRRRGSTGKRY